MLIQYFKVGDAIYALKEKTSGNTVCIGAETFETKFTKSVLKKQHVQRKETIMGR